MSLDLHLHTYHSDGRWSPTEVVENAVKVKLKHIAITDHDTVSGIEEAREARRRSIGNNPRHRDKHSLAS